MKSVVFVFAILLCVAQVLSQTCTPPTTPPQTSCAAYDNSLVPECAPYISYTSVLVTDTTPLSVLAYVAQSQLSQLSALPPNCGVPLTEMICHLILQECVEIPLAPGVTLALPRTPCKETCQKSNDRCAQLFSMANKTGQNCDALGPTCSPLFVETESSYTLIPGTPAVVVPCQPSTAAVQDPIFYCEDFKGEPSVCKNYISKSLAFSIYFDQKTASGYATSTLANFAALPDACRFSAEEYFCRTFFKKCVVKDDAVLPTKFYYGADNCRSDCNQYNVQCGELFGLSGANLTDCSTLPKDHATYTYNSTELDVPCLKSDLTKAQTPPMLSCTKWQGSPKQCKPYFPEGNDTEIFYLDAFQLDARVSLTETFIAMLQELPKTCRNYATEMICRTLLQECKKFNADDLPTTYYIGKPGCKKICKQVRGCEKELRKIGIPPPDCDEDDALTGGKVYPASKTKLLIPNHDYSVSCINSIYSSKNKDDKKRFTRDVGDESEVETEDFLAEDEVDEEKEDEDFEPMDPKAVRQVVANTLGKLYGAEHPAAKIGLQMDQSIEEMVRTLSEKLVRRVHF